MTMKIGELAQSTNVSTATIRYYESIGLLPAPARGPGDQRIYQQGDVQRLDLIRRCRGLGFTTEEIGHLARAAQAETSGPALCRTILERRVADVRRQLDHLKGVETRLVELMGESAATTNCDQFAVFR